MSPLLRNAFVVTGAAIALALQAACARSEAAELGTEPSLIAPGAQSPGELTACVATECPAPWASCAGAGLCATDTSRDVFNCGACAAECPHQPPTHHATSVCSGGKCSIACDPLSADCNKNPADGCEIYTGDDPKNCGGCGKECKDGELCWKGACGCPNGFTQCETQCKNLQVDGDNCGSCGTKCKAPPAADPEWRCGPLIQPSNTRWSCETGGCRITCMGGYADCNASMCTDGCEIDTQTDPLNCGGCGIACAANQQCKDGTCLCPAGTTRCADRCVDVNVDPNNCGACGNGCPGAEDDTANGSPTCSKGRCGYQCYVSFADCDNRLNNGCEVDIGKDPQHCGSCNTHCDKAGGQPCVLGQCLTKPCGPVPGTF